MKVKILIALCCLIGSHTFAQTIPVGAPVWEEALRRQQLLDTTRTYPSFMVRPFDPQAALDTTYYYGVLMQPVGASKYPLHRSHASGKIAFGLLPAEYQMQFNSKNPYGWGDRAMIPNRGFQQMLSAGFYAKLGPLSIQLRPEWVTAQNRAFDGFESANFSTSVINSRFIYWNSGDNPERIGTAAYQQFFLGQSSIRLNFGAFSLGYSTENIAWGPGQFNGLIFSDNAPGFQHLTFNTRKPAKTFLGNFEGQLIMGRLESSNQAPTQDEAINNQFFSAISDDWRYLNGINISYNPKWVKGLYLGLSRTFQFYSEDIIGGDWQTYFPIFEAFQKERVGFSGGNSVEYDNQRNDQQVAVNLRWVFPKSNAEIYMEYGRRDHALNWRDFFMSPDHASAYLFGFQKLVPLPKSSEFLQIRAEVTRASETPSTITRYIENYGISWNTQYQVRGFTQYGQPLGVGSGPGSNVETVEIAWVRKINKLGLQVQRLENQKDFFNRAFGDDPTRRPWN